jgi:WD40 repeat protein
MQKLKDILIISLTVGTFPSAVLGQAPGNSPDSNKPTAHVDAHGDALPAGALARLGSSRWRHGSLGHGPTIQFLPGGQRLLSNSERATRMIWDVRSGKEVLSFTEQRGSYSRVAVSPDGKLLVTGSDNGVFLYNLDDGKLINQLAPKQITYLAFAFSPDGKTLAAVESRGKFGLWDLSNPAANPMPARWWDIEQPADFIGFSADGKTLLTGTMHYELIDKPQENLISCWDPATGKEVKTFNLGPGAPNDYGPRVFAELTLSPDRRLLAVCSGLNAYHDHRIDFWNVETGKRAHRIDCKAWPAGNGGFSVSYPAYAFTPDGKSLVYSWENQLIFYDVDAGAEVKRIGKDLGGVDSLAVSPDGKTIALSKATIISLLDASTGKPRFADDGNAGMIDYIALSADGRLAATARDGTASIWDARNGKKIKQLVAPDLHIDGLRISADGKRLIVFGYPSGQRSQALMFELSTGKQLAQAAVNEWSEFVAISRDETIAAFKGVDPETLGCLDMKTGKERWRINLNHRSGGGRQFAFSLDGRVLTGFSDKHICRWDATNGHDLGSFLPSGRETPIRGEGSYHSCVTTPDGGLVAIAYDVTVVVHEAATGKLIRKIDNLLELPFHLALSADGKTLAWASVGSSNVHVVDIATGKERQRFSGQRGGIVSLAISSDCSTLASSAYDTTIMIWDLSGAR